MPAPFPRTLRALHDDGLGSAARGLAAAVVLLAGWTGWFTFASVRVYERSETARVEVDGAAQAIQTPVSARVAASYLVLGRLVHEGEVLVELDANGEKLALDEATRRRDAATAQIEFLRAELAAADAATTEDRSAALATLAEARAKTREAQAHVTLATEEAHRLSGLRDGGHVGEMELLRAASEAESRAASAEASALDVSRLEWALRAGTSDRLAAVAKLKRDIAMLEGDANTAAAAMARLAYEVERRKLRSPVEGRIGDISILRESDVVHEGDRLATVVPPGELRVVAEFSQATAVGRVRPGQAARVRLSGFNWAEYGTLAASVKSVGSEPRAGRVLADLRLQGDVPDRIPLQHGLSGVVDVEVEQTTPAKLVLRAAGRYIGASDEAAPPATSPGKAPVSGRTP